MIDETSSKKISILKQRILKLEKMEARRKEMERSLRNSQRKYKFLSEKMSDILWIMDMNLKTIYVSPSIQRILGFTQEERLLQTVQEQLTPDSLSIVMETLATELLREQQEKIDPERTLSLVLEFYHKDGSTRWLESLITGIRNDQGTLTRLHGVSRDITKRKQAEDDLREREEQYHLLIEKIPIAICIDAGGKIIYANPAFLLLIKASSMDEIAGRRMIEFVHPELIDKMQQNRQTMIAEKRSIPPVELNLKLMDGSVITAILTPMPVIFQKQPAILTAIYEITDHKRNEIELQKAHKLLNIQMGKIEDLQAQLKEQVIRDSPTGLYNRHYLQECLNRELTNASRRGCPVGIAMIDIDNLKQIHDRYGQDARDIVLRAVGNYLPGAVRYGDIVCRYGEDEFLLMLPNASKARTAERAEQLRDGIKALKTVHNKNLLQTTVSVGIAAYPADGTTAEAIIRAADQSRNQSKASR